MNMRVFIAVILKVFPFLTTHLEGSGDDKKQSDINFMFSNPISRGSDLPCGTSCFNGGVRPGVLIGGTPSINFVTNR